MAKDIEKEYSELSKKYKLPKFKDIDEEFELSSFDTEKFLLKSTLRRIAEKLEFYIEVIGNLVHPDGSSISSMYEIRFFSDNEKNEMYMLFKKMMRSHRNVIELVLSNDAKEQAQFLNEFFAEWMEIKNMLRAYIGKMKESWEKETSIQEDLGYFG
ncbi:MAG: hypothetical protein AABX34_06810 [Nanoarchaeota archaeon]|mgnify:CR=1 FL=1